MRSKINKLCTNLYQTPISTNGAKIILKKHGPKQQDSCMQMKKTKPVNLKLWTIRIRCHICKLTMIYRTVENLRHNHPSIGTNMCCEFRLRKQNAGLRDAVVRFVYMVSNHFTGIRNRFDDIAMPKVQNIYDAWCSICVLKSIHYARIYTRNQFLQMVQK